MAPACHGACTRAIVSWRSWPRPTTCSVALHVVGLGQITAALNAAEASDAITLWHMLPRVMGAERLQVAQRIAQLIEVPSDIALDRIMALDPKALEAWWNALGVGPLSDWKSPDKGLKNAG
jgi:hypothetical protein